uniref:NADH-ubiquinone oxidoreductase chain 4L n=1 Tax=Oltmannsiellopsis viridis TaxID=51324 RepID=Q0QIP9_OLTVI|nr:NADH dehydrogenase subunit 4L [Oltmannsiellopsis viridis]ABC96354.1 NADH dehydrogenase subunit 4L [Oltmannsiellopsis viridis]
MQIQSLTFSSILFLIGLTGIYLNRKSVILLLMSIELLLLAVNLNFLMFSATSEDIVGEVFALFVLTVAAAEAAIGLALLVIYYRVRGSISIEFVSLLKS